MEAGGHVGPVATSVLAQEILPELASELPVFVAGGIGLGGGIAGFLVMGASGVQLGTRFLCDVGTIAHTHSIKSFIRSSARAAVQLGQVCAPRAALSFPCE